MKIIGQRAAEGADHIPPPVREQFNVENFNLEHVAGLGTFYRNWTGQNVSGEHPFVLLVNFMHFRRNEKLGFVRQHVRTAAHRIDGHFISACDE